MTAPAPAATPEPDAGAAASEAGLAVPGAELTAVRPAASGRGRLLLVLLLACGAVVAVRYHSRHEPLETDVATYMIIAQDWAAGNALKERYWDVKPVGTFVLWRGIGAAFGYSEAGAWRASCLAAVLATVCLVFLLHSFLRPWMRDACALLVWPLCQGLTDIHANGANLEVFLVPLLLASLLCLARYWQRPTTWLLYAAILPIALGFTIKQVVVPFFVLPGLVEGLRRPDAARWKLALGNAIGEACLALMVVAAVYGLSNLPNDAFLQQQWEALTASGTGEPLLQRLPPDLLGAVATPSVRGLLPLLLASAAGVLLHLWRRRRAALGFAVLAWPACYLAAILPGTFAHYFILLLPAVILGLGLLLLELARLPWDAAGRALAGSAAAAAVAWLGVVTVTTYFRLSPEAISTRKYGVPWFVFDRYLGLELRARGYGGQAIWVGGTHTPVYIYSGTRPALRHMNHYVMRQLDLTPQDYAAPIYADPPPYIVLVGDGFTLPGLESFLEQHYVRVVAPSELRGAAVYQRWEMPHGAAHP